MKLWKDNKIDKEYELTDKELLNKFDNWASKQTRAYLEYYGVRGCLPFFIGKELNSVVNSEDLEEFKIKYWDKIVLMVYRKY